MIKDERSGRLLLDAAEQESLAVEAKRKEVERVLDLCKWGFA